MPEPLAVGTAVQGSRRAFWASAPAPDPVLVWHRWTTPSTWGDWDLGLRSALLDGDFQVGAAGRLIDASGRTSRFVVRALEQQVRCVVDVTLPGAVLRLTRTLGGGVARHDVAFHGLAAPLFATLLGGRFRRLIGPTVAVVVTSGGNGAPER